MKTKIGLYAAALLVMVSCTKEHDSPPGVYQIVEFGTNTALEGAKVDGYKCLESTAVFGGCIKEQYVRTTTSDANGNVSFPASDEIAILKVSKSKYWSRSNYLSPFIGSTTLLEPIATLKIRFLKTGAHAFNNKLYIMVNNGDCWGCKVEDKMLGQPVDTTIYLKILGNGINHIEAFMWDGVARNGVIIPEVNPHRFDTVQVEVRY